MIRLYALGLLFISSALLTSVYGKVQSDLVLEGNNLHSANAVEVHGEFDQIAHKLENAEIEFVAFRELTDLPLTRGFFFTDGALPGLPLHDQSAMVRETLPQAWVGANITAAASNENEIITVLGVHYPVTATLGKHAASILLNDTLLIDPKFFIHTEGSYVFDGPAITREKLQEIGIDATAVPAGMNHRTNIDYVTPIIVVLNSGLSALGGVVLGVIATTDQLPRMQIFRLLGHSLPRLRIRTIFVVLIPLVAACAVAWMYSLSSQTTLKLSLITGSLSLLICGATAGMTARLMISTKQHP